jgi:hypothetical protein
MKEKRDKFDAVLGILVIGIVVTGAAGLLAALFAAFTADWFGVGICLIAAALSFGHAVNALLRD